VTIRRPSKARPLAEPTTIRVKPGVTRIDTEERIGLRRERKSVTQYEFDALTPETFREALTLPDRREALQGYLRRLEGIARAVCNRADITWDEGPWPKTARPAKNTAPSVAIELLKGIHVLTMALATARRHIEEARTAKTKKPREAALNDLSGMMWEIAANADDVRQSYERLAELAVPSLDDPTGRTPVQLAAAAIAAPVKRAGSVAWWITAYRSLIDAAIDEAGARGGPVQFMALWRRLSAHDESARSSAQRRSPRFPTEPGMRKSLHSAADAGLLRLPAPRQRGRNRSAE